MRLKKRTLESCFFVISLIIFSGAFIPLLRGSESSLADGDPLQRAIYAVIYATTAILALGTWPQFLHFAIQNRLLLIFLLLIGMSAFWSGTPPLTIRRSIAFFGSSLFGIYFVYRNSLPEQLKLLAIAFGIVIIASTVFALFLPEYGVMTGRQAGAWRGVFGYKNALGRAMVMGFTVLLSYKPKRRGANWIRWLLILLTTINLIFANSITAFVLLAVIVVSIYIIGVIDQKAQVVPILVSAALLILAGTGVFIVTQIETIMGLLGREMTLTGRTQLWYAAIQAAAEHRLLGYGYGGFWQGVRGPSYDLWLNTDWINVPPHAHNGALDIVLDLGLFGLALFLAMYLLGFLRSFKLLADTKVSARSWPMIYLIMLSMINLTESNVIRANDLYWALLAGTLVWLANRYQIRLLGAHITPTTEPETICGS